MAVNLIGDVNKSNAFDGGFLDSKYAQQVVDRSNIWSNMLVQSPIGVTLGSWVVSESNAILVLNPSDFGYPWIESDALGASYAAVLGNGTASFSKKTASPLSALEIETTGASGLTSMSLIVGDDSNLDTLLFTRAGGSLQFGWSDNEITLTMINGTGGTITLNSIASGGELTMGDAAGNAIFIATSALAAIGTPMTVQQITFMDGTSTTRTAYFLCTPPV